MRITRQRTWGALGALVGGLAAGLVLAPPAQAVETVTAASSTTTTEVTAGVATTLAGMSVTATDAVAVSVSTSSGVLHVNTATGVSLASGFSNDAAELTFTGTPAQVNDALDELKLTAAGADKGGTATVSITARPNGSVVYSRTNEHFYQYVSDPGITWEDARTAAKSKTYGGQSGYLATVPNSTVNALITSKIPGAINVWLGGKATDESTERVWRWMDGPLAGTAFSKCDVAYGVACSFSPSTSAYRNWANGEPNNWDDDSDDFLGIYVGESYIVTNWTTANGKWNDLRNDPTETINGYVVEYGDQAVGSSVAFSGVYTATATLDVVGVPNAPTGASATAAVGQVSVAFTAPSNDGGPNIDKYSVTATPGGASAECTTSPCTVTGLTAGTTYSFTVKAHNSVGWSSASSSSSATPGSLPGAPTSLPTSAVVGTAWSINVGSGGYPSPTFAVTSGALPAGISLSSGGTLSGTPSATGSWTFEITATNAYGSAAASTSGSTGATPSVTSATLGSLTWNVPIDRTLVATGTPDPTWSIQSGSLPAGLTLDADGRLHGTPSAAGTYSVTLRTGNTHGADSKVFTGSVKAVVPDAPAYAGVLAGDGTLTVAFTAPAFTGGGPLTTYEYSLDGGSSWTARSDGQTTSSPLTISGLTNGAGYSVKVRAVNADEHSAAVSVPLSVPCAPPSAPSIASIEAGNHNLTVHVLSPADSGGAAIIAYQYTLDGGSTWNTVTIGAGVTKFTIYGLADGVAQQVQIRAVTVAGHGASSGIVSGTPTVTPDTTLGVSGGLPELQPGTGAVVVNGEEESSGVSHSSTTYTVTAGSVALSLSALDTQQRAVKVDSAAASLVGYVGGYVRASGHGFLPGSTVDLWLFSDPVRLGTVTVGADGSFSVQVPLPSSVNVGEHTIQANGLTAANESISAHMGLKVSSKVPQRLASTGGTVPLAPIPVLLVVGVVLVVASRRLTDGPGRA